MVKHEHLDSMLQMETESLKSYIPEVIPLLHERTASVTGCLRSASACMTFFLSSGVDLLELIGQIRRRPEMSMLYYCIPSLSTDFGRTVYAYCKPAAKHCFTLVARTGASGSVTEISVTAFLRMEDLCFCLLEELETRKNADRITMLANKNMVIFDFF